jgi:sulfur-carrier protein
MVVKVRIPTPLRKHTGDKAEVAAEGATIKEVFEHLDRQFPGFRQALYDQDGTLKRFINVYLNDEDIRYIGGESAPVTAGNVVSIVPAIAGGIRS